MNAGDIAFCADGVLSIAVGPHDARKVIQLSEICRWPRIVAVVVGA